jgi:hypothetical protein
MVYLKKKIICFDVGLSRCGGGGIVATKAVVYMWY